MLFNVPLFSSLLLAPVVLAVPSGLSHRIPHRGRSHWQSQVNDRVQRTGGDEASTTQYSANWAGAVLDSKDNGTFHVVTGTFTVPTPSGSEGASASAWVGIDGDTCESALFQAGVTFTTENGAPTYYAWYEWFPAYATIIPDITISAGDVIQITVLRLAWSANAGLAMIENLTHPQLVSEVVNSSFPLCGQNAEWIVEDYSVNGRPVPFADFGTVTFTDAGAAGIGEVYTPFGAKIYDIQQNGRTLTEVSISGDSITIEYL